MNTLYFYGVANQKVERKEDKLGISSEYKLAIEHGYILGAVSGNNEEEHYLFINELLNNLKKENKEDFTMLVNEAVKRCNEVKKEDMDMAEEIINKSFEELEEDLKKETQDIEGEVTDVVKLLSKEDIKEIFNSDKDDSYRLVIEKATTVLDGLTKAFGENDLVISSKAQVNKLSSKIESFLNKHGRTKKVLNVIKGIIKKVCSVALKLVKFTGDITVIIATLIGRIALNAGKETVSAAKEVKNCFNHRFL